VRETIKDEVLNRVAPPKVGGGMDGGGGDRGWHLRGRDGGKP
jgi:hypothetical protein